MTSVGALKSPSIQLQPLEKRGKSETQECQAFCERGEEPAVHVWLRMEVKV